MPDGGRLILDVTVTACGTATGALLTKVAIGRLDESAAGILAAGSAVDAGCTVEVVV